MAMAIATKFIGPTNTRGSRVKATVPAYGNDKSPSYKPVTLGWSHGLNVEENHRVAARELATNMNWEGLFIGNSLDGGGYVFCRIFLTAEQHQQADAILANNYGCGFYIPHKPFT